jgi:NADPH:quinone reductase-like Zn-dependent oxidoreductase
VKSGELKPEVGHVMPLAKTSEGFLLMLHRKNYGKIILTV